ncbi:elongation factor P 5-aminopentanone reductase [Cohnella sp.]|uniref:elongation factor P 5-aminopentanone reductase n=1 Tax=Cohnella sp. TaxID=1883426 RepID=UPI0035699B76
MKRIALVTGSSRGIGAAIVRTLAADGLDVVIQYHEASEAAENVASECRAFGSHAITVQADLRSAAAIQELKQYLDQTACIPNIVVHCAGLAHYGLLEDMEEHIWDELMHIHLKSAYYLTKGFGSSMRWQRWGRFVHLTSVWGLVGAAGEAAYAASKGGLNAFTKSMAKELASFGITVNAVAPGAIDTDMLSAFKAAEREELCREIPIGRLGHADEVAQLVRFLVSDDASYITGQVVGINGGWHM